MELSDYYRARKRIAKFYNYTLALGVAGSISFFPIHMYYGYLYNREINNLQRQEKIDDYENLRRMTKRALMLSSFMTIWAGIYKMDPYLDDLLLEGPKDKKI